MKNRIGIAFVRVDVLANWRFWHDYEKTGNFEEAGKKVIAIANALLSEDAQGDEVVEKLLEESRLFQEQKRKAGRKGGFAKARNKKINGVADNREESDESEATTDSNNMGTADADARETSENIHSGATNSTPSNPESGTSAAPNTFTSSDKTKRAGAKSKRLHALPPTKDSVYIFAQDNSLDEDDAREWYEINYVEREGCDKYGEVIKNWQGHLINYCKAKAKKRSA